MHYRANFDGPIANHKRPPIRRHDFEMSLRAVSTFARGKLFGAPWGSRGPCLALTLRWPWGLTSTFTWGIVWATMGVTGTCDLKGDLNVKNSRSTITLTLTWPYDDLEVLHRLSLGELSGEPRGPRGPCLALTLKCEAGPIRSNRIRTPHNGSGRNRSGRNWTGREAVDRFGSVDLFLWQLLGLSVRLSPVSLK